MSFVGKKFPNLSVNAMNEMGDTFKINVLEAHFLLTSRGSQVLPKVRMTPKEDFLGGIL